MPRTFREPRRDFLRRVRSGSLCLVVGSCLLPCPICRPVSADNRDGFLAQSLDAFVENQEASLKAARDKALKSIVEVRKQVKTYKLTQPSLEKRLDRIDSDFERCRDSGALPTSDDLVDVAIKLVEERLRILREIEIKRTLAETFAAKSPNAESPEPLIELESRIWKSLDGRPDLKNSGLWKGNAINSEGWLLAGVQLTLYEASDGSIEANMRRIKEDTPLAGRRTGRLIDIQTPHSERRTEQLLGIRGYLVGRRYIARVKGFDAQREWTTAWINLTQEKVTSDDLERMKRLVTQRRRNELQQQKEKDLERQKSKESKDVKTNKKRSTKKGRSQTLLRPRER